MSFEKVIFAKPTLDEFSEYCWEILPLTRKTIQNYRGAYRRNISEKLGNRELGEIAKRDFVDVLAPLAPQNHFQTLMALRFLYREALARDLVDESPVASIKPPQNTSGATEVSYLGAGQGRELREVRFTN